MNSARSEICGDCDATGKLNDFLDLPILMFLTITEI